MKEASPRGLVTRRGHLQRIALLTLGWALLVLGIVGGLLPIIQGWPFGVLGAALLYLESRWVQRRVRHFRRKHPKLDATFRKGHAFLKARRRKRDVRKSTV